jgi:hypothetical protein
MPAPALAKESRVATSSLKERIRLRAYELYLQRCNQSCSELNDWLQAEEEVRREEEAATKPYALTGVLLPDTMAAHWER